MPIIVGILIFVSRIYFMLSSAELEKKNNFEAKTYDFVCCSEQENGLICLYLDNYEHNKAQVISDT